MSTTKYLIIFCLGIICCLPFRGWSAEDSAFGPLYDKFNLTLDPGTRTEILGPAFYSQWEEDARHTWSLPPYAQTYDPRVPFGEYEFCYPLLTYNRFGTEWRWQFCQLIAFAGGKMQSGVTNNHFTLFPIYFQQRSSVPKLNYTALLPFYGHVVNRLFRDEVNFVMLPLYVKNRRADVVTYNMPYPLFHLRYGDGLKGWQVWPFVGEEHKSITTRTNGFKEVETIGGHDYFFVMWPCFFNNTSGIGTTNVVHEHFLIPFYTITRSPARDSTSILWLLGVTHTLNHEKDYDEWDAPWPLVVFARGPGKHTDRVFPFFSKSYNSEIESSWIGFLLYKYNSINSPVLQRSRARVLYFLYSDTKLRNPVNHEDSRRIDFWPFFTRQRNLNGNVRLQILAILEPLFPTNESIERDYSQLYSLWRSERNPRTGGRQQSLLWNLYRHTVTPRRSATLSPQRGEGQSADTLTITTWTKKTSLLFGLFQYQSGLEGWRWRVCYVPFGKSRPPSGESPSTY